MGKTLYTNAKVYTLNASQPIVKSFVVDEDNGSFAWTGDRYPSTADLKVRDLQGQTVFPGLVDAHTHLQVSAIAQYIDVDCRFPGVKRIPELLERLRARAGVFPAGKWIVGQGVHFQDQYMEEKRYPSKAELDQASTDHPIAFRSSFHVTILNSLGLQTAGITRDTPDPPGGEIERDANGEPTGVTRDMHPLLGIPDPAPEEKQNAFARCIREDFLAHGVTTVFEISHSLESLQNLSSLDTPLRIGVYLHVPATVPFEEALNGMPEQFPKANPYFAGIKLFIDGGTTSMAAAFNKPYTKDPSTSGTVAYDVDQIYGYLQRADKEGLQVAIHAVGDRAQDMTVEAMRRLNASGKPRMKHRIEHGGNILCTPERQEQFREVGLLPVPNPGFIHTFGDSLGIYLGEERTNHAFPFRTMIQNGLQPAAGGDCVGTDMRLCNPWFGMWSAVTRKTRGGGIFHENEAIGLMDALRMYTEWSAKVGGLENIAGSIEAGKQADFIILGEDPFEVPVEALKEVRPLETWIGGKRAV